MMLAFLSTAGQAQRLVPGCGASSENLAALGQRMLEDSLAIRFGVARAKVPDFGAWAYDWAQSYVTAYRIAGRAAAHLGEAALGGTVVPGGDALAHDMAAPVRAAFRDHVTRPSFGDGGFAADMAHLAATLAAEAGSATLGDELAQSLRLAPDERLAEASGTETIFLRSMRPLAARFGALAVRVSEAGSVLALGSYFGYSLVGAPGVLVGGAGGLGLAWGVDWAINRVDAGLNRANFEARVMAAIDSAEAAVLADGQAAIALALAQMAERCR
jgi:hypothetical protein